MPLIRFHVIHVVISQAAGLKIIAKQVSTDTLIVSTFLYFYPKLTGNLQTDLLSGRQPFNFSRVLHKHIDSRKSLKEPPTRGIHTLLTAWLEAQLGHSDCNASSG